ncbi:MAG: glycosyltransferase family 4 protein, partial [Longimicrobiales bacterium]
AAAGSDVKCADPFKAAGIPFQYFRMDRGWNPINDARTYLSLARVIKKLKPDLVHAFATKPAVWGRLAARRASSPVIVGTLPGLGSLYSFNDMLTRVIRTTYEPLQRRACYGSDLTIFQNQSDLNHFVDRSLSPELRSVIIPGSGVRTDRLDPKKADPEAARAFRRELDADERNVVVTMIARVIRSKGVREFAEAARILRESHPNIRFALVGPEDKESWDSLTPSEFDEVKESVRWLGRRSDVRSVYAGSDVFVLPSYREGMPRVLLEAASMELPLVAARNPGCEAVVDHQINGFLVEPQDASGLASKIRELAVQPLLRKRFARASREIAVRRFDLTVVAEMTARHYQRLLTEAGVLAGVQPAQEVRDRAMDAALA